jgi:hypothetical protein
MCRFCSYVRPPEYVISDVKESITSLLDLSLIPIDGLHKPQIEYLTFPQKESVL